MASVKAGTDDSGANVTVSDDESLTVIQAVHRSYVEADDAKKGRMSQNRRNRDVYLGRQDWSYKQDGQSREFLPKVSSTVEQTCAFVKRGLINFGDWFSVDIDRTLTGVIDGSQIREVLKCFFNDLWDRNNKSTELTTVLSDAVKVGLLESLIILKVHGGLMPMRRPKFAPGSRIADTKTELLWEEDEVWRLRIDIVRPEDFFPDPSGNGLYEIHRVERDLHEVIQMAEDGVYDMEVVKQLIDTSYEQPLDEKRTDRDRNQLETTPPGNRKKVLLMEFWGTLLNSDGTVAHRNIVTTVANERYLIRKPEPNPFWHQESPFVVAPLVRVPFSVWHKALYDHAVSLNITLNELFSLMIDGAIASVWGIKQVRVEDLEDPSQVANGIAQGATLAVKNTLPHNADVLKIVATGQVPGEAMSMFEAANREYNTSAVSNELKVGQLPPKKVLATEVVEVSQSTALTLDGMISDLEAQIICPAIRKSWMNILQNADDIPSHAWSSVINKRTAMMIMRASPEERYALFSDKCQFRVFGLSATMQRALDFQKMMALMQATTLNPMLMQAFMAKMSGDKALRSLMRALNLNPDMMEMDPEEQAKAPQTKQEVMGLAQSMQGGNGQKASGGPSGPDGGTQPGASEVPGQINQLQSPATGLPQ